MRPNRNLRRRFGWLERAVRRRSSGGPGGVGRRRNCMDWRGCLLSRWDRGGRSGCHRFGRGDLGRTTGRRRRGCRRFLDAGSWTLRRNSSYGDRRHRRGSQDNAWGVCWYLRRGPRADRRRTRTAHHRRLRRGTWGGGGSPEPPKQHCRQIGRSDPAVLVDVWITADRATENSRRNIKNTGAPVRSGESLIREPQADHGGAHRGDQAPTPQHSLASPAGRVAAVVQRSSKRSILLRTTPRSTIGFAR